METNNCAYCGNTTLLSAFGYFAFALPTSNVYVFKEQSKPGRLIVAHKKHVSELVDLTREERAAFMEDIAYVAKLIHVTFHPQKLNYGAYGDTGKHLHFHLVPKYEGGDEWGSTFTMNNQKMVLSEKDCEQLVQLLNENRYKV